MISFDKVSPLQFDIAFFGLGYEPRSTHAFGVYEDQCLRSIVFGYDYNTKVLDYQKNKDFFLQSSATVLEPSDKEFGKAIENALIFPEKTIVNVCIDITVMSRHRVALALWALLEVLPTDSTITIVYCLSKFIPPPIITPPVKNIGPIIEELNGTPSNIGLPPSLVVSLGYEEGKALGAANYIDASEIVCLIPQSKIGSFESNVIEKNKYFLKNIPKSKILKLNLHSPQTAYYDLKSIIHGVSDTSRPILLPLGPKIISALAVILGWEIYPSLPVWRVSSKEHEKPIRREASEHKVSFTIRKTQ